MVKADLSSPDDPLFESILTPPQDATTKARGDPEALEEAKRLLHKKNKVIVGKPKAFNVISKMEYNNEKIPFELMSMKQDHEIYEVNLSCSFIPDADCEIKLATFGVNLFAKSPSGEKLESEPIALSMFPDLVETEISCKNEYTISSKLSFIFKAIGADIGGEASQSKEYLKYEPKITASGVDSSEPVWDFTSTVEKSVYGNKHLMLLVQIPKNSKLFGRFFAAAEAKTKGWLFPKTIPIVPDDKLENIEREIPTYG